LRWLPGKRGNSYRVVFYFGGKKQALSLGVDDLDEADGLRVRIERRLKMLEQGDLALPPGADLHTWLLTDGKIVQPLEAPEGPRTLHALFEAYFASLPPGELPLLMFGRTGKKLGLLKQPTLSPSH
jgi:hypothetical protein